MSISTEQRKQLVKLAEELAPKAVGRLKPTQVNNLISVALVAQCEGELRLFLRYQASRKREGQPLWPADVVDQIVSGLATIGQGVRRDCLDDLEAQERLVIEAWRLFGAFFKRAFAFEDAQRKAREDDERGHSEQRRDRR